MAVVAADGCAAAAAAPAWRRLKGGGGAGTCGGPLQFIVRNLRRQISLFDRGSTHLVGCGPPYGCCAAAPAHLRPACALEMVSCGGQKYKKCSTFCSKRQKITCSLITLFGPTVPSQISADLDVGRRPTDDCAEICEGTVGRSPPICEKSPPASPGKLQPMPPYPRPTLSCDTDRPQLRKVSAGVEGSGLRRRKTSVAAASWLVHRPPLQGASSSSGATTCLHPLTHLPLIAVVGVAAVAMDFECGRCGCGCAAAGHH